MFALVILTYILFVLFISLGAFLFLFFDWKWLKARHRYSHLPTPKLQFIVGAGLELMKCKEEELFNYLETKRKEVGSDVIFGHVLGRPNVFLLSPQDIEVLFKNVEYLTKGYEYKFLKPWFRNGLNLNTGEAWLARKKLLLPAYHKMVLKNYFPSFNKHAKQLTKVLADESQRLGNLNIENYLMKSTLDIIMDTMLGVQFNCLLGAAPEYINAMTRACDIILKRVYTFWMQNDMLFNLSPVGRDFQRVIKKIHNFSRQTITERKRTLEDETIHISDFTDESTNRRKSFLDYLLALQREHPTELTDEDIIDELQVVFSGANDSITIALVWILFMIAVHPEVQRKLRKEIEDIFNGSDRDVTLEDIQQLNYMEMVISESLRLYPSFPFLSRWLETDLKLEKYTIPAGTNAIVIPFMTHRDPKIFPDPEKFDPARFTAAAIRERHSYSFLAFSAGYRNCVGKKFAIWEMKTMLATIFRHLTVSTHLKRGDVKVNPQLVSRPSPHIYLTFKPEPI